MVQLLIYSRVKNGKKSNCFGTELMSTSQDITKASVKLKIS